VQQTAADPDACLDVGSDLADDDLFFVVAVWWNGYENWTAA
jgi:hypothetical protein